MTTLFALAVTYNGKQLVFNYRIPADAHNLGVVAREWKRTVRIPFGDIEADGADLIEDEMKIVVDRFVTELRGAWDQDPLF